MGDAAERFADRVLLMIQHALGPMRETQAVIKAQNSQLDARLAGLEPAVMQLRERLAVTEVRTVQPGPPGKDGADGIGLDQLIAVQDPADCRVVTLQVSRGNEIKTIATLRFAIPWFRGDYKGDWTYQPGDEVRLNGIWLCETANPGRPGPPDSGWKLLIKGNG